MSKIGHYRIIVADDHPIIKEGLDRALKAASSDMEIVDQAYNGNEMLKLVDAHKPDLVLVDLNMPEMGGEEAIKRMKKKHPKIKALAFTAFSNEYTLLRLIEAGADGYIEKSTDALEIVRAIHRVIEKGFYINRGATKIMFQQLKTNGKRNGNGQLTEREIEVLKLICEQNTNREISQKLFLSPRTIDRYREKLLDKTQSKNTAGLVLFAVKSGLVEI